MEFTSQICTTREQSKRLLALGLKKETADCSICKLGGKFCPEFDEIFLSTPSTSEDFPAWSLHRLIEISDYKAAIPSKLFDNLYDDIIATIQSFIRLGYINKEYLNMDVVNARENKNVEMLMNGGK